MNIFTAKKMKWCARHLLQQSNTDYRKIVLFHEAVLLGGLVLMQLLSWLLNSMAGDTGGLSGIGTRSLIGTVEAVCSLAVTVLMPFWSIGIFHTSIGVVRRQRVERPMLAEGFRRFGLVLRYYLMMIVVAIPVALGASMIAGTLAMLLPETKTVLYAMMFSMQDPAQTLEELPMDAMLTMTVFTMAIYMIIVCGVTLYINYRLFAASYLVMDEACPGAAAAMGASNRLTKGYKWKLLKLDLSFWWYYLLQFAAGLLVYGNVILTALGIELPMDSAIADLLFYILYIGATLAIAWFAGAYINTTHACAYQQILDPSVLPEE